MLLAYVDESYRDIDERFYLAAVVSNPEQTVSLTAALDQIVNEVAVKFGMKSTTELHGYEIWHATEDWRAMKKDPDARGKVLVDVMSAIAAHSTMAFWRGVDVQGQKDRGYKNVWPVEKVCFQHVLERLQSRAEYEQDHALVIRDEISDTNIPREDLRSYRREGTQGYRPTDLPRIVDTVHFAPSKHSRMLQAADVMAYVSCLHQYLDAAHEKAKPVIKEAYGHVSTSFKSSASGIWPS
jgi:hypothetical protein